MRLVAGSILAGAAFSCASLVGQHKIASSMQPDNTVRVQAVNNPDAGVSINSPTVKTDPGRKLSSIQFNVTKLEKSVRSVLVGVTVLAPTGEVRSGEIMPVGSPDGIKAGTYDEPVRSEIGNGDGVVLNVARVVKGGSAYMLPSPPLEQLQNLWNTPIQDFPGGDATATPNIVCDVSFCDYCAGQATSKCTKGVKSFACTIHPSCSCNFTCQ